MRGREFNSIIRAEQAEAELGQIQLKGIWALFELGLSLAIKVPHIVEMRSTHLED